MLPRPPQQPRVLPLQAHARIAHERLPFMLCTTAEERGLLLPTGDSAGASRTLINDADEPNDGGPGARLSLTVTEMELVRDHSITGALRDESRTIEERQSVDLLAMQFRNNNFSNRNVKKKTLFSHYHGKDNGNANLMQRGGINVTTLHR